MAGAEASPVADSEELVSWDDAEGTIEREREQFSDPFVVPPSSRADGPLEPPAPTTSDPSRTARLERFEQWAETVRPEDLAAVSDDDANFSAEPDSPPTPDTPDLAAD